MSITELREKRTRRQPAPSKGRTTIPPERAERLTGEEIYRLTEPGHRKRSAEICREIARKAFLAD
jgi:hypothetical protein